MFFSQLPEKDKDDIVKQKECVVKAFFNAKTSGLLHHNEHLKASFLMDSANQLVKTKDS